MTQAEQSVTILNGIGAKKAEALARLGLTTLGDLARWYPRAYEDRRKIWPIRQAPEGEPVCVCAVVAQPPRTSYVRKGLSVTHVTVFDDSSSLSLTFFNQPYLSKQLLVGQSYVFYGALELNGTRRGMVNPVFEPEGSHASTGRIVPVYPLTAGISSRQLAGWIAQALTEMSDTIPDDLPPKLRLDHQLPARDWAIRTVHAPPPLRSWSWRGGGWCLRSCFTSRRDSPSSTGGGRPERAVSARRCRQTASPTCCPTP